MRSLNQLKIKLIATAKQEIENKVEEVVLSMTLRVLKAR